MPDSELSVAVDVLNGPELRLILTALRELAEVVDAQAEDEGLWFFAHTAPEAYQQQELRRLHAAVEATVNVAKEALR